ncbi:hypothetical protein CRG98_021440 [Punica granatum]|uniref:Uncharacterized protein n=1 Tax=Punica granatum TaxID=22663 RepID=A0A2I0JPE9_PUNGR|nr:hypothetical protein CRG98_021440 [Punica granatum]
MGCPRAAAPCPTAFFLFLFLSCSLLAKNIKEKLKTNTQAINSISINAFGSSSSRLHGRFNRFRLTSSSRVNSAPDPSSHAQALSVTEHMPVRAFTPAPVTTQTSLLPPPQVLVCLPVPPGRSPACMHVQPPARPERPPAPVSPFVLVRARACPCSCLSTHPIMRLSSLSRLYTPRARPAVRLNPSECAALAPEHPSEDSTESPNSRTLPGLFPRIPRLGITFST